MTTPQELADRLEKARDAIVPAMSIEDRVEMQYEFRCLVWDELPTILAALRSASASGEGMREAALFEALKQIAFLRPLGPTRNAMVEKMERIAVDAIDAYSRIPSGETREEVGR